MPVKSIKLAKDVMKPVRIRRKTEESLIQVSVDMNDRDPDLKKNINTRLHFFNHMIEHIAWRSLMNIKVDVKEKEYLLDHVITEDVGLSYGTAMNRLYFRTIQERSETTGVNGMGVAISMLDESMTRVAISFEERGMFFLDVADRTSIPTLVEDVKGSDLIAFMEGFTNGARCTLHIDLMKGRDPHHIFESIFRAFGEAMRGVFAPCSWRRGTTPGVAGNIQIDEGT